MSEDWAAIAAEVAGEIADLGLTVTVSHPGLGPQTPWSTEVQASTDTDAKAVDMGIRSTRVNGEIVSRRVLLMAAGGAVVGDTVTVREVLHVVTAVYPLAPGGSDVMVKVELQA